MRLARQAGNQIAIRATRFDKRGTLTLKTRGSWALTQTKSSD
jgi:hypothetical protein